MEEPVLFEVTRRLREDGSEIDQLLVVGAALGRVVSR